MKDKLPITITELSNQTYWIECTIGKYKFSAKHFDVGSEFGINKGRVSKLSICENYSNWGNSIISYDRGWNIKPKTEEHGYILSCLLEYLEKLPKRFE